MAPLTAPVGTGVHPIRVRTQIIIVTIAALFTPPEAVWVWPVSSPPSVVRDFDAPESPWGAGHRGLDLRARVGERVRAPHSGIIHFSGDVAGRGVLTIRTANGELISMEPITPTRESGRVRAGETVGHVQAGHCRGGCLHIGLRIDGEYRSPARELGILRRAVLVG